MTSLTSPSPSYGDNQIYDSQAKTGVAFLICAGVITVVSVLAGAVYYLFFANRAKTFHRTNIAPYLVSLLLANVFQAIGTIMSAHWVQQGIVYDGSFCASQGAIKNAANVGTAIWSFTIAVHVFNLLFLRWKTTKFGMIMTLFLGWLSVLLIVAIGPLAYQTPDKGAYFGVSGLWCWITDMYPEQRTYLEYFIEFMSAGLGFLLYVLVLLRVRGNLVKVDNTWTLRWIPRSQAWQLAFDRDRLDAAMLRVVQNMVWYPVAYSFLVIPVAIARFSSFMGHHVPFWVTILTDFIFNLTGFVNIVLFISTYRILPDTASLPKFTTPRSNSINQSDTRYGVTPFVLDPESLKIAKMYFGDDEMEPSKYGGGPNKNYDRYYQEREESRGDPNFVVLPTLSFQYPAQSARH